MSRRSRPIAGGVLPHALDQLPLPCGDVEEYNRFDRQVVGEANRGAIGDRAAQVCAAAAAEPL
jgi:hypothetical protein